MSLTKVSYSMVKGSSYNVLDYGAVGNGIVDDTNAIKAAMTAASALGKRLFFPAGIYLVTDSLDMCQYTNIFGEYNYQGSNDSTNNQSTIIQFSPTSAKSLFVASSSNGTSGGFRSFISIDSIAIFGNSATAAGNSIWAFDVNQVIYSSFRNMKIWSFRTAFYCRQTIGNKFDNIQMGYQYISNITYSGNTPTTDSWTQCYIAGPYTPIGVDASGSNAIDIRFNNCTFESLVNYGVKMAKECASWSFTNCYSEDVPSSHAATDAMFRVGYEGTANPVTPSLCVFGGIYNNGASVSGIWMDVDEVYSVKIYGAHIVQFDKIIRYTANTFPNAVSLFGNSCQAFNTFFNGPAGKFNGIFGQYGLNNGDGNIQQLRVRDVTAEGIYSPNATLYIGDGSTCRMGSAGLAVVPLVGSSQDLGAMPNYRWNEIHATIGLTLITPDLSKTYRISIDNAGAVITTLVP